LSPRGFLQKADNNTANNIPNIFSTKGGDSMTTKRDILIAILTTFCLTATLFMILPTRSSSPYDPWLDTNDDGVINIREVTDAILHFQASGDPTKNVNVTNFPTLLQPKAMGVCANYTVSSDGFLPFSVDMTGYQYISIFLYYRDSTISAYLDCLPCCFGIAGDTIDNPPYPNLARTLPINPGIQTYSTINFKPCAPYLEFRVRGITSGSAVITIVVYCFN
jgi:hypothetical protein